MRLRGRVATVLIALWAAFVLAASVVVAGSGPTNYRVVVHPAGQQPLQLYVEEMGRGPPMLLLHGLGGSSYSWRAIAPALAATHRVIAIDLRGFGRSDKPFDTAYGPADHSAVVRAFIRERRLANLTLVGHSYGGVLALLLAMDPGLEQHRIARLVVIDTPAFPQDFSPAIEFLRKPVLPYVLLNMLPPEIPTTLAFALEKMGFDKFHQRDIDIYADPLSDPGGPHALIQTARNLVPPNAARVVARYPTILKPALVMSCREDQVVPIASAVRLSRTLPNARLAVLERCDHIPLEQAPEAVIANIKRFVGR